MAPPLSLSRTRLVLFDIDGTMLRGGNRVHSGAILQACAEVVGSDVREHFAGVDAGGRTDRFIVSELLRRAGFTQSQVDDSFDRIAHRATELTESGLQDRDPEWVLPGVHELLSTLLTHDVAIGLVTGNLPRIAEVKLRCGGIWSPFAAQAPLVTGFGHLSEDRNELSRHAFAHAQRELDTDLDPSSVVIVGDTPRDIECAQTIGAQSIAVTTGRYDYQTLSSHKPTYLYPTLEHIELIP